MNAGGAYDMISKRQLLCLTTQGKYEKGICETASVLCKQISSLDVCDKTYCLKLTLVAMTA
jgi:hypothetical protein